MSLSRGSKGSEVQELQSNLKQLGFYTGNPDGDFGPLTEAAVKNFQSHCGLEPDGIVGDKTNATIVQAMGAGTGDNMQVSDALVNFISNYEGFSATPYRGLDKENLTIGYGHVIQPGEDFSNGITKEQALVLLKAQINGAYAKSVNNWARSNNVKLSQQQFDALVSFVYNVGTGALATSTLCKDIKSGTATPEKLKDDFLMWTKTSSGDAEGLRRRRLDECEIYINGDYKRS